jgi:hypothetical protein
MTMRRIPPTCSPPSPRSKEEREDEFVNYLVKKALDMCIATSRANAPHAAKLAPLERTRIRAANDSR